MNNDTLGIIIVLKKPQLNKCQNHKQDKLQKRKKINWTCKKKIYFF